MPSANKVGGGQRTPEKSRTAAAGERHTHGTQKAEIEKPRVRVRPSQVRATFKGAAALAMMLLMYR